KKNDQYCLYATKQYQHGIYTHRNNRGNRNQTLIHFLDKATSSCCILSRSTCKPSTTPRKEIQLNTVSSATAGRTPIGLKLTCKPGELLWLGQMTSAVSFAVH